jgi:DNA invertase Pin-like site-specific DNA recombinase
MLGAIAEYERDLIRKRFIAGDSRSRALGKHLGWPRVHYVDPAPSASDSGGKVP